MMQELRSMVIAMILLLAASQTWGQNLVVNPDFDVDVAGWTPWSIAAIVWSPLDANGSPASGSALVTNLSTTPNDTTGAFQCLNGISPEAYYRVAAQIMVPGAQIETGFAYLLATWYDQPGCIGYLGLTATPGVLTTAPDAWYAVSQSAQAPAGVESLRLQLSVWKDQDSGDLRAHFDNVELEPCIFADGFESGDTSAWSATLP